MTVQLTTPHITSRQLEVVRLMAEGLSYQQIANSLGISKITVRNHLHAAYENLGASHCAHAVRLAWRWLDLV